MLAKFRSLNTRQKLAILPTLAVGYAIYTGLSYLVLWAIDANNHDTNTAVRSAIVLGMIFGVLLHPTISRVISRTADLLGGKPKTPTT